MEKSKHLKFIINKFLEKKEILIESSEIFYLYWTVSSLRLLLKNTDFLDQNSNIVEIIKSIKSNLNFRASYLFASDPNFIAHICIVYTALAIYKTLEMRIESKLIDEIIKYLYRLKNKDGSFKMYENGESDIRGTYSAVAILKILDIENYDKKNFDVLIYNCFEFIVSCQSYEGGFSGIPGNEAHGGYTYCAVAGLSLLNRLHNCNVELLIDWLYLRFQNEDDFLNGRTDKEVDSCYCFWIGACFKILNIEINVTAGKIRKTLLERYQVSSGGFRDKEKNEPDLQHTCYSLFFLALYDDENDLDLNFTVDPNLGTVIKKK